MARFQNGSRDGLRDVGKTLVFSFGRMSPPTNGHEKLVDKVVSVAKAEKGTPAIYVSHSYDKKKNPLPYDAKVRFLQTAFGGIVKKSETKTAFQVAEQAYKDGYTRLIMVVGSDRVAKFQTELNKYNAPDKLFNFDELKVVSAGERDPDADDVSGMSASKMRAAVAAGDFEAFKKGLPKKLAAHAKEVYDMTHKGMGLTEGLDIEEEEEGITLDEAEALTFAQRRKRGMVMKRYKAKLKNARERSRRRKASDEKLKSRARRKARNILRAKFAAGKQYGDMTPAEKIAVDKRVSRIPQSVISRISTRMLPQTRKAELQRIADLNKPKHESVELTESNDPIIGKHKAEAEKHGYHYNGTSYGIRAGNTPSDRIHEFRNNKVGKTIRVHVDGENGKAKIVTYFGPRMDATVHKTITAAAKHQLKEETATESWNLFMEERTSVDGTPGKKHHDLLKKDGSVKLDKRFKMFKDKPGLAEIYDLKAAVAAFVEAALKPSDREDGTKSLVKAYAKDTPGEDCGCKSEATVRIPALIPLAIDDKSDGQLAQPDDGDDSSATVDSRSVIRTDQKRKVSYNRHPAFHPSRQMT